MLQIKDLIIFIKLLLFANEKFTSYECDIYKYKNLYYVKYKTKLKHLPYNEIYVSDNESDAVCCAYNLTFDLYDHYKSDYPELFEKLNCNLTIFEESLINGFDDDDEIFIFSH